MQSIRFDRFPRTRVRGATPRRLAAARTHLSKEVEKAGLFAAEVAAELPTPEERIANVDERSAEFWDNMRSHHARAWLSARAMLRTLPDADRCLMVWRNAGCPGESGYFSSFVRAWPERRAELDRPLTDAEKLIYQRLLYAHPDWIQLPECSERMAAHELVIRGFANRRFVGDIMQWQWIP